MRMKKQSLTRRVLIITLALVLSASLFAVPALADQSSGDWTYTVTEGEATVTGYTGNAAMLTIPSTLDGYPVTGIAKIAFENLSSLTSVTIPSSVTHIENNAFSGCTGLQRVDVSDLAAWCAIEFAGAYSNPLFYAHALYLNGVKLTSLTIPSYIPSVGDYAFYGCSNLTSLTVENGVMRVGGYAFYGCSGLTSAVIPDSVTDLGNYVFYGCSSLKTAVIGKGVSSIGDYAFQNCSSLSGLSVGVTVSDNGGGEIYYIGTTLYNGARIGRGVTSIGKFTFNNCTSLASVSISGTTKTIGESAFYNCTGVTELTLENGVGQIGNNAFCTCSSLKEVTIPDSVTSIGLTAFSTCSSLQRVTVGAGVTRIESSTFFNCSKLMEVALPHSLSYVGSSAFSGCSSLALKRYAGTPEEWGSITIADGNNPLKNAALHNELYIRYESKTLLAGESFRFTAAGGSGTYTWHTGNTEKATVDAYGKVTAKAAGNTYLYCTDTAGAQVRCLLKITTPLSIRYSSKTIKAGESFQFTATGGSGAYTWRMGNTSVAAVDSTGKVTGKAAGNTYLYCKDSVGTEVKCLLKVTASPLSIRYSSKTITTGDSFQFTATGGTGDYTWRTGNTAKATVDAAGKAKGIAAGNTYLYCTDSTGTEVKCLLKVVDPLSIRYSEKTVKVGASFQFNGTGGSGTYTWRVGNSGVATVDSTGKVTGVAVGNTYLYCKDSYGTEVRCLVKIK